MRDCEVLEVVLDERATGVQKSEANSVSLSRASLEDFSSREFLSESSIIYFVVVFCFARVHLYCFLMGSTALL